MTVVVQDRAGACGKASVITKDFWRNTPYRRNAHDCLLVLDMEAENMEADLLFGSVSGATGNSTESITPRLRLLSSIESFGLSDESCVRYLPR